MLLLLTACADLHHAPSSGSLASASPAPVSAPASAPAPADGPALLSGPGSVAAGALALAPLDEAGLAALLANPGPGRLVVNFWATWCGPCVAELADLRAVATERSDVRFALINVESPRSREAVLRFLTTQGSDLPSFQLDTDDPSGMIARAVPAWAAIIPVTLVIDPGGAISARFDGMMQAPALRAALAR